MDTLQDLHDKMRADIAEWERDPTPEKQGKMHCSTRAYCKQYDLVFPLKF
jgi:hypothetical protein